MNKLRILFVCGRNQWRSPTAERIYKNDPRIEVRSAGVSSKSKQTIQAKDIEWADLILVMERKYSSRIRNMFRDLDLPKMNSLDIPDEYQFMDEALIDRLKEGVEFELERHFE